MPIGGPVFKSLSKFIAEDILKLFVITKTCLYNVDPLEPHFYIVKLGFTGVYIIFHIVPTIYIFEQKYENYQNFSSENFHFLVGKNSVYLNRHVFVMVISEKNDLI